MRVNREELLKVLQSVSPGLAAKEILEQSSCLVFLDGKVATFNDEVACSRKSPLDLTGAVKAKPLLELLGKLAEDDIEVEQSNEELLVKGKRRKAGVRMEAEVMLPVDAVEEPEEWMKLPAEFGEAVSIVHTCASGEESQFVLTCVHIHPEYLEACDKLQIVRYPLETGVEESTLVRAESLRKIVGYDMTEMAVTLSWLHFRNPAGLVLSCRRHLSEYKNLDPFISPGDLEQTTLPGGLEEVVAKAEIFSSENATGNLLTISLSSDRIVVEGRGASGWYKEMKQAKYSGPPVSFMTPPKLLLEIVKKSPDIGIGKGRLFVDVGKFRYAAVTKLPETKEAAVKEEE